MEKLGEERGQIFYGLWQDTAELQYAWNSYSALFEDRDLIALIKQVASSYFGNLQQILLRDLILRVCRLADPQLSSGKHNLSLKQLENFKINDEDLLVLRDLHQDLEGKIQPLRDFRNKLGSHNDLEYALGRASLEFTPHVGMIRDGVNYIKDIMRFIESIFNLGDTDFSLNIEPLSDYQAFVAFLKAVDKQSLRL